MGQIRGERFQWLSQCKKAVAGTNLNGDFRPEMSLEADCIHYASPTSGRTGLLACLTDAPKEVRIESPTENSYFAGLNQGKWGWGADRGRCELARMICAGM